MGIQIERTNALIGLETMRPKLNMQSETATITLKQNWPQVNIHTEQVKVFIDQYEAFASAGLKNNADLTAEAAQKAYQQFIAFVGKEAQDGKMLAAIENGGNPIAYMSKRDSVKINEFGLDFIPKVGPKFEVTGSVTIDPVPNSQGIHNGVEGEYNPARVEIKYAPGQVNTYLRQYASIKIDYIPNKIDEQA